MVSWVRVQHHDMHKLEKDLDNKCVVLMREIIPKVLELGNFWVLPPRQYRYIRISTDVHNLDSWIAHLNAAAPQMLGFHRVVLGSYQYQPSQLPPSRSCTTSQWNHTSTHALYYWATNHQLRQPIHPWPWQPMATHSSHASMGYRPTQWYQWSNLWRCVTRIGIATLVHMYCNMHVQSSSVE